MYLRIPGRRMVPVFGYTGTGALLARIDENKDLWIKSRETGYFTDLRTGDILETWANPFTGKTVPVYHFYNDLLVGKVGKEIPKFFLGTEGDSPTLMNEGTAFPDASGRYPFVLPFETYGDDMMLSWDYTHDYTNPSRPRAGRGRPRASARRRRSTSPSTSRSGSWRTGACPPCASRPASPACPSAGPSCRWAAPSSPARRSSAACSATRA